MELIKVRRRNTYKIGVMIKRKNAKRHLFKSFQAVNDEEAKKVLEETAKEYYKIPANRYYRFVLCTGNWKPICYYDYKHKEE